MQYVFPGYYKDFRCKAGECAHNCCIGWEIEIDRKTADFYNSLDGSMGSRLKDNIVFEEQPHFKLGTHERCPFLNKCNLCDIIIELGEEHLCNICKDHPRFRNELPGRVEIGVGLCCEAAAELVLSQKEPMTLVSDGEMQTDDEIIILRDRVIALLQNREKSVADRVSDMLTFCGAKMLYNVLQLVRLFLTLERLDSGWTDILNMVMENGNNADFIGFDDYMKGRQIELEQFVVYLAYRHLANAYDFESFAARAAFIAASYALLYAIGAAVWTETGQWDFVCFVDTARMFSAEIEYSDENLYILLDSII